MSVPMLTASAGFLLAVLWMDLIFDTQILRPDPARHRETEDAALASIAAYYRRATTSRPMSVVIVLAMATLVACVAVEAVLGERPAWLIAVSAVLAGGPILLALARTVPAAVRLGGRTDPPAVQVRLARRILRDHLACLAAMSAFLVLWVVAG